MTWDPDAYGTEGPLKIGFQGWVPASNPAFMNATSAIGIYPTHDLNNGSTLGVKQGTMTIDENFLRSSSYDSHYMASQGRSNLNVMDRAIVARIIFDQDSISSGNQSVEAVGVTFLDDPSGVLHNVSCKNEVILAAGAFHSPFILKQSGIGPQDELEQFGITPIVVNENVGHNMQDHTSFSVIHEIKPEFGDIASTQDMTDDLNVLNNAQWGFYAGGSARWNSKYSATGGATNAFQPMSNSELESMGAGAIVEANLTNQVHNEFQYKSHWYPPSFSSKYGSPKPNTSYISCTIGNMAALLKGSVTINSNDPFSDPVIDNNVS
jgi:choline dehydrogenase